MSVLSRDDHESSLLLMEVNYDIELTLQGLAGLSNVCPRQVLLLFLPSCQQVHLCSMSVQNLPSRLL